MTIPLLIDEATELQDDGDRKGQLGFSLTAGAGERLKLKTLVGTWEQLHKLLIAISKEVGGPRVDWEIMNITVDDDDGSQRINLTVRDFHSSGAKAEQLFVDLMNLLKERRTTKQ